MEWKRFRLLPEGKRVGNCPKQHGQKNVCLVDIKNHLNNATSGAGDILNGKYFWPDMLGCKSLQMMQNVPPSQVLVVERLHGTENY